MSLVIVDLRLCFHFALDQSHVVLSVNVLFL